MCFNLNTNDAARIEFRPVYLNLIYVGIRQTDGSSGVEWNCESDISRLRKSFTTLSLKASGTNASTYAVCVLISNLPFLEKNSS